VQNGYTRAEKIEGYAQFSVRGDIIDIFPPNEDNPVRIELWGDEIDTISYFDLDTQRRIESITSVDIPPVKEAIFDKRELLRRLRSLASEHGGRFQENVAKDMN
jgi:transcription-repair coupling factor (superfamily II helicase)